ncbi:hypothetical protein AC481_02665 [miscellaneous Crenarchaeota group archaeon SMTZ-80]|nr:MAG: hypothetical protein AC481_02665 [miscellaneous Crenarchaeota group archaeon SMTZ-80]
MFRILLISCGTFFIIIGFIGIFLPLLPTTPFLLLAAACYARGSKKFYNWLITNRWFGEYIKNYREKKGIPIKTKVFAILILWITISYSIFIMDIFLIRIILIIVLTGVTFHLLTIKTLKVI